MAQEDFAENAGLLMTPKIVDLLVSKLEVNVIRAVRKPFYMIGFLLGLTFVLLFGVALFLSNLEDSVHNTDKILTKATGPEAQAQQKLVVQSLLHGVDCTDQLNLQRLVDRLNDKGVALLQGVEVVEPGCRLEGE